MPLPLLPTPLNTLVMLCFAALLAAPTAGFAPAPAAAQTTPSTPNAPKSLDIVLLVDQSASMGAYTRSGPASVASDPRGLRFATAQYFMDSLATFRVSSVRADMPVTVGASVLYFGDQPTVVQQDWVDMTYRSEADWTAARNAITNKLSSEAFPKTLGNSDYQGALSAAIDQLNKRKSAASEQVVIIILDGDPCVPRTFKSDSENCSAQSDKDTHMKLVQDLVRTKFNGSTQKLYVIGLDTYRKGFSDTEVNFFWRRTGKPWLNIAANAGSLKPLASADQLLTETANLLSTAYGAFTDNRTWQVGQVQALPRAAGGALSIQAGQLPVNVPAFQQTMIVTMFDSQGKTDTGGSAVDLLLIPPGEKEALKPPSAVSTRAAGVAVRNEVTALVPNTPGHFGAQTWVIANPAPGDWHFGTRSGPDQADGGASYMVSYIQARLTAAIDAPAGSSWQAYQPVTFSARLVDALDSPLAAYDSPDYRLSGHFTVTPPDAPAAEINLSPLSPNPSGASNYTAQFVPFQAGSFSVSLDAIAATASSGQNRTLSFHLELPPFSVKTTTVRLTDLAADIPQYLPVRYTLQLVDAADHPLPSGSYVVRRFGLTALPEGAADCAKPGPTAETLSDFTLIAGQPTLSGSYQLAGKRVLCLMVALADDQSSPNNPRVIFEGRYGTQRVRPVTILGFKLMAPAVRDLTDTQPLEVSETVEAPVGIPLVGGLSFPYWPHADIRLEVRVIDDKTHQDIALATRLPADYQKPFPRLRLLNSAQEDVTGTVGFQPTANPAAWTATLSNLPRGDYSVLIDAPDGLVGTSDLMFRADPTQSANDLRYRRQFTLRIIPNSAAEQTQRLMFGLAVVALAGLVELVSLPIRDRVNRLGGSLAITRRAAQAGTDETLVSLPLTRTHARRRVRFRLGEFPVVRPPLTALSVRYGGRLPGTPRILIQYRINNKPFQWWMQPGDEPYPFYKDSEGTIYSWSYTR